MELWLWIILAALFFGSSEELVTPFREVMMAVDGDDAVTLGCQYNSSSSNDYLFWYKQDGNNSPKFILSRFKIGEGKTMKESVERFSSTLDSTLRSVPLKIQKLQLTDSAVYYCALQPTVTGNTTTLYKNSCYYHIKYVRWSHTLITSMLRFLEVFHRVHSWVLSVFNYMLAAILLILFDQVSFFWFRLMDLVKLFKTFIGPFSNRPLHPTPTHYPPFARPRGGSAILSPSQTN
uniref:Ig-like domain-containing protein n=1 Tax=Labrus bergylta TaxID=56723 RepID=A0A3Q3MT71_9LABR